MFHLVHHIRASLLSPGNSTCSYLNCWFEHANLDILMLKSTENWVRYHWVHAYYSRVGWILIDSEAVGASASIISLQQPSMAWYVLSLCSNFYYSFTVLFVAPPSAAMVWLLWQSPDLTASIHTWLMLPLQGNGHNHKRKTAISLLHLFQGWRSEYSTITYLANQGYLSKHIMMKIFMKLHTFFKGIFWTCPLMSWFSVTSVGVRTSAISQSGHDRVYVVDDRDYYLFIEHLHSIWWSLWQPTSPIG